MFNMEKDISKIKEEVNNRENSARKLEYEVNSLKYTMDNIAMNESKVWQNESKIKYDYSRVSNPKDNQKGYRKDFPTENVPSGNNFRWIPSVRLKIFRRSARKNFTPVTGIRFPRGINSTAS